MARRTRKKRNRTTAESPLTPVNSDSDVVRTRLARIESNYQRLDEMLTDLEARVPEVDSSSDGSSHPKKPR